MKGYIGSVRFFKNLILLFVLIFIAIPSVFAICYRGDIKELEREMAQQKQENQTLEDKVTALEAELNAPKIDPEGPAYQSLYPDFYAPQELTATTYAANTIYLTFDDGPSYRTEEVLQILREEGVKATFFVIGHSDSQSQQWMRDIVADGHTIAMHSYSHEYDEIYASVEDFLADMYEVFCLIKEATGVTPTAFRFPGGSINGYNYGIYQDIISEMLRRGFVPYDWNISSGDAGDPTSNEIISYVVDGAYGTSRGIVLMHDSAPEYATVNALRSVISNLRDMGFTFDCIRPDTAPILYGYNY